MKILLIIASVLLVAVTVEAGLTQNNAGYMESGQSQGQKTSYFGDSNGNYVESADSRFGEDFATAEKPKARTSRGLGISAWGIIALIIGAILLTATGYYALTFYPYVCKKQSNYKRNVTIVPITKLEEFKKNKK